MAAYMMRETATLTTYNLESWKCQVTLTLFTMVKLKRVMNFSRDFVHFNASAHLVVVFRPKQVLPNSVSKGHHHYMLGFVPHMLIEMASAEESNYRELKFCNFSNFLWIMTASFCPPVFCHHYRLITDIFDLLSGCTGFICALREESQILSWLNKGKSGTFIPNCINRKI